MKTVPSIQPRVFDIAGAAIYIGKSTSFVRNGRYEDMERIKEGKPRKYPRWTMQGRNVRYYREDLDAWLDSFKDHSNETWDTGFHSDTAHLKNQNA